MSHPREESAGHVIMLGTAPGSAGGVAAVIAGYREAGLEQRWRVVYLVTHVDGTWGRKLLCLVRAFGQFLRALLRHDVALVHAHSASRWSFRRKSLFLLLARWAGVPTVLHLHGGEFDRFYTRESTALGRAFIRHVLRRCDRIIVLSAQWQDFITDLVGSERVVCIGNGVPVPNVVRDEADLQTPPLVVFLGRLSAAKGIPDLLEAVALLARRGRQVHLLLAGDGDQSAYRAQAVRLGIADQVSLPGWLGPTEKRSALSRASLFCLPSHAEGVPMALLEAMAVGCPVVATRVGGIPDVVRDGVDGLLVPPGSVQGLADAMECLLGNPDRRQTIGTQGRRRIEQTFSLAAAMKRLDAVYRDLGLHPGSSLMRGGA